MKLLPTSWKPIPFTDRLVVETMAGRKTVTRRPFRIPRAKVRMLKNVHADVPILPLGAHVEPLARGEIYSLSMLNPQGAASAWTRRKIDYGWEPCELGLRPSEFEWVSPWGAAGDGMWVREAAKLRAMGGDKVPGEWTWFDLAYRADGKVLEYKHADLAGLKNPYSRPDKYQPPMFMPRWACRTRLLLRRVTVERLQDITDEDIAAEGVEAVTTDLTTEENRRDRVDVFETRLSHAVFADTWDAIYGKGSWERNDWVWRLEYSLL